MNKEKTEVFQKLLEINGMISQLNIFPPLAWAWTFDILKDIYENNQYKDLIKDGWADEAIPENVTLNIIFDKFYDDVETLNLNMDLGGEILEEVIRDWMRENDFLVALDQDGWMDGGGVE